MFDKLLLRILYLVALFFNRGFSLCLQRKFSNKTVLIRAAALAAAGSGTFCFASSSGHGKDSFPYSIIYVLSC